MFQPNLPMISSLKTRITRAVTCRARAFFSVLLGALCVSALPSPLFAQSCALCYESAKAAGNPAAIDRGILVLLLPTLFLFVGVLVFTIRRANSQQ